MKSTSIYRNIRRNVSQAYHLTHQIVFDDLITIRKNCKNWTSPATANLRADL